MTQFLTTVLFNIARNKLKFDVSSNQELVARLFEISYYQIVDMYNRKIDIILIHKAWLICSTT